MTVTMPTPAVSIEQGAVESYPDFLNTGIARTVGMSVLPEVMLNPDLDRRSGRPHVSEFNDHTGYRFAHALERALVTKALDERLLPGGDVSISRVRYMRAGVKSGWHSDGDPDIRCIVGYLGVGELFIADHLTPILVLPGTVVRIDNTIPIRLMHNAVSLSKHRVIGVYGRYPE